MIRMVSRRVASHPTESQQGPFWALKTAPAATWLGRRGAERTGAALHDPLTGVPNQRHLEENLLTALGPRLRTGEQRWLLPRSTKNLGFSSFGGDPTQNWLILKNGETVIGLFQGMFEKNMLTFNPGWNQNAESVDAFTDVRELQRELKAKGADFLSEADEGTTALLAAMLVARPRLNVLDPDGNPVLVDQHV
jgi:hypothetical protein